MGLPADSTRAGELLNSRYRLGTYVGDDGPVEIYEATDGQGGAAVTVLLLKPEYALQPAVIDQLVKMAQAQAELAHPNFAQVLAVASDDTGIPFVVEAPTRGRTLSEMLREFPDGMPMGAARVLLAPIVEGIARAHVNGAVHGRLHPDRIVLVEGAGGVVPRVLQSSPGAAGSTHGPDAYTPPECRAGKPATDPAADVWSVGVLLYEVLSGRAPEIEEGSTLVALEELVPHLPDALTSGVAACLWDDPGERVPDAGVLWMRIEAALSAKAPAKSDGGVGASAVNALGATMIATAPVVAGKPGASRPQPVQAPANPARPHNATPVAPRPDAMAAASRPTPLAPAPDPFATAAAGAADPFATAAAGAADPFATAAAGPTAPAPASADGHDPLRTPPPPAPATPAAAASAPRAAPAPHATAPSAHAAVSSSPPGFGLATGAPPAPAHAPPPPPARPAFAAGDDRALLGSAAGAGPAAPQPARPAAAPPPPPAAAAAPPPPAPAQARAETDWPEVHVNSGPPPAVTAPPAASPPGAGEPAKGVDELALAFSPLDRDKDDVATAVGFSSAPPRRAGSSDPGAEGSGQRRKRKKKSGPSAQIPGSELSHEDGFTQRSSALIAKEEAASKATSKAASGGAAAADDAEARRRKGAAVSNAQVARLIAMRQQEEASPAKRWLRLLLLLLLLLFIYEGSTLLYDPELKAAREVFGEKLTMACVVLASTSVVALVRVLTLKVKGGALLMRPMVYLFQAVTLFICILVAGMLMSGGAGAAGGGGVAGGVMGMLGGVARGGLVWSSSLLFLFAGIYAMMEGIRSMSQSIAFAAGLLLAAVASGGASYGVVAQTVLVPRAKPVAVAETEEDEDGELAGAVAEEGEGEVAGGAAEEGEGDSTQEYLEMTAEAAASAEDEDEDTMGVIDKFIEAFTPKSAEVDDPEAFDQGEGPDDPTVKAVERTTMGGGGDELEMVDQLREIRQGNAKDVEKLQEQMPSIGQK